jgi:hypothetical protein
MGDYESSSNPWLGGFLARCWFGFWGLALCGAIGFSLWQSGMLFIVLGLIAFCVISFWALKYL